MSGLFVSVYCVVIILFNCLVLLLCVLVNILYFDFPADNLNGALNLKILIDLAIKLHLIS